MSEIRQQVLAIQATLRVNTPTPIPYTRDHVCISRNVGLYSPTPASIYLLWVYYLVYIHCKSSIFICCINNYHLGSQPRPSGGASSCCWVVGGRLRSVRNLPRSWYLYPSPKHRHWRDLMKKHSTNATHTVIVHKNIHLAYTYKSKSSTMPNNHYCN